MTRAALFLLLLLESRRGTLRFSRPGPAFTFGLGFLLALMLLSLAVAGLYAATVDWSHAAVSVMLTLSYVLLVLAAFGVVSMVRVLFEYERGVVFRLGKLLRVKGPGVVVVLPFGIDRLRKMDLFKLPGVAETIDWANCLVALDKLALDPDVVNDTLGVLLKYRDDLERVQGEEAQRLVAEAKAAAAPL